MVYQWPGNIRELSNVVERAVVLATEDLITPDLILLGRQTTRLHKSISGAVQGCAGGLRTGLSRAIAHVDAR